MDRQLAIQLAVQNIVRNKIGAHRDLLVAYSGGVDSTVLLHALTIIKQQYLPDLQLRAIYIHHGISQNADSWANHCQQQCLNWQIPCLIEKVTLDLELGNIEEQARKARYCAMSQYLATDTILCTAQHLDDQSETFFLALKRGSGPTGLSAMAEISDLNDIPLLRPLLTITRAQIEQYAKSYELAWIEDESNQDDHYDRNFLRLHVLPLLNQRWPHFNQMVARSAELCQEQQQLVEELLVDAFHQMVDEQKSLSILPLLSVSSAKRNALLRMWFKLHQIIMPSRKQLDIIWQTVVLAREDSNPLFILANRQVRRYQHRLYLLPQYRDLQSIVIDWDLKNTLILPDSVGQLSIISAFANNCRLPLPHESVSIRFNVQGMLSIVGRQGARSIKKIWQEKSIPPWMRTRTPLIFYNEVLITAVGVFVTEQGHGDQVSFLLTER